MPHLVLEASANLHESNERLQHILISCQNVLVDELPTQIGGCKSRLIVCEVFVVGDGDPNQAFLHLTVKILKKPERTPELLKSISEKLQKEIIANCSRSMSQQGVGVSVEIMELSNSYTH
ncbi:MAG: hypothetical protein PHC75_09830 [Burkholderiales bacterium]|nr:hypothetical protein [Burkholderiales bacterium]